MKAFYDLQTSPFSWDFLSFMVCARTAGATEIVFVPGKRDYQKLTEEQQQARLKNLLIPLCDDYHVCETREEARGLLNGSAVFPKDYSVDEPRHSHMLGCVIALRKIHPIPAKRGARLKVEQWLRKRTPVTITIRENPVRPGRNSNMEAWLEAGEWMRSKGLWPLFIPDTEGEVRRFGDFDVCERAAEDVSFRIALYDRAALNLGVANGPMMACVYSYRPMLMFKNLVEGHWECSADYWVKQGLPPGIQPSWFTQAQRIVWFPDYKDVITEYVAKWGRVQAGKDKWENFQMPVYAPEYGRP